MSGTAGIERGRPHELQLVHCGAKPGLSRRLCTLDEGLTCFAELDSSGLEKAAFQKLISKPSKIRPVLNLWQYLL